MSSSAEKGPTSLFEGSVSSTVEREFVIDEEAAARSLFPNSAVVTALKVSVTEGEEYLRKAPEESVPGVGMDVDRVAEEASEWEMRSVDIMGGNQREIEGFWEGFTFADILQRAELLSDTLLEIVDTPELPLC